MAKFTVIQAADDAAHNTLYSPNSPQLVYSATANKTFWAYLGLDRDLYIREIDHNNNNAVSAKVLVDTRTIDADDDHAAPSIDIDLNNHLHIAWGSHDTYFRHVKSDNPLDISAWTAQTVSVGNTYNFIRCDPASGNLYVFYRADTGDGDMSVDSHSQTFPSHEYAAFIKSTDEGDTWSAQSAFIDTTGTPETHSDAYLNGVDVDDFGLFHIVWNVAVGTQHDDTRQDWYHAIFDPATDTLEAADGTALGSVVTWAEHDACRVASDSEAATGFLMLDADRIYTWWFSVVDDEFKFATWTGSAWNVESVPNRASNQVWPVAGGLRSVGFEVGARDALMYSAPLDGSSWTPVGLLKRGALGFSHASGVLKRGPVPAFIQERDDSNEPNSATEPDLVPVYVVVDDGAALSSGCAFDDSFDNGFAIEEFCQSSATSVVRSPRYGITRMASR